MESSYTLWIEDSTIRISYISLTITKECLAHVLQIRFYELRFFCVSPLLYMRFAARHDRCPRRQRNQVFSSLLQRLQILQMKL